MNIWVIIAAAFSIIFLLISLGNTNKPAAVFLLFAALLCDVYLAYVAPQVPNLIRYAFLLMAVFQLFTFVGALLGGSKNNQHRGYYRR